MKTNKKQSECVSPKMKIAKFRPEHMKMMHVLQMLLISLEEIYDCVCYTGYYIIMLMTFDLM